MAVDIQSVAWKYDFTVCEDENIPSHTNLDNLMDVIYYWLGRKGLSIFGGYRSFAEFELEPPKEALDNLRKIDAGAVRELEKVFREENVGVVEYSVEFTVYSKKHKIDYYEAEDLFNEISRWIEENGFVSGGGFREIDSVLDL